MRGRPAAVAAAAVALAAALAACGVPTDPHPRAVEPPAGYDLASSPPPSTAGPGRLRERLYFVRDDKLVPVVRRIERPSSADAQLGMLVAGPTDAERDAGLTTALTGVSAITAVRVSAGEASVELGDSLAAAARTDEILAFGQIVCTLTARDDVDRVSFFHDDERLGIPRADGSLSTGPLTSADYASLTAGR